MESAVITTIISTSGAVIVGLGGMWISTNRIGKRIDVILHLLDMMQADMKDLNTAMTALEIGVALLKDKADL